MLRIVLCVIAFCLPLFLQARTLIFSPIPYRNTATLIENFSPIIDYLNEQLHIDIKIEIQPSYDTLLQKFKDDQIDIIVIGSLPLVNLMRSTSNAFPVVTFKEESGHSGYRCVLVKFKTDPLPDPSAYASMKVALTQPLSTCGYWMSDLMVRSTFKHPLDAMLYRYVNSHDDVALSVIRGEFLLGGMKDSVAQKYQSLGLEVIASSALIPGFSLVLNTHTLSSNQIESIKNILLETPPQRYHTWGKTTSYGMQEAHIQDYLDLDVPPLSDIPQKGNMP